MKQWKKVTSVLMMIVFLIGTLGSPVSAATKLNKGNQDTLTVEQLKFAEVVMENLENYTDLDGNPQIKIINKNRLQNQMNSVSVGSITFEELETTVSKFNYYMSDGENALTELVDDVTRSLDESLNNGYQTMR